MAINIGIFGDQANVEARFIPDFKKLGELIEHLRALHPECTIVATSGTFDLLGIGHARYLSAAKDLGDVLIVGIDSDAKTKRRKGEHRPIVEEAERMEMLTHLRYVDIVTMKTDDHVHLEFLQVVRPDILVISATNNPSEEYINEVSEYCKKVELLEPQAQSSTTTRIRNLQTQMLDFLQRKFPAEIENILNEAAVLFGAKKQSASVNEKEEGEV